MNELPIRLTSPPFLCVSMFGKTLYDETFKKQMVKTKNIKPTHKKMLIVNIIEQSDEGYLQRAEDFVKISSGSK